MRGRLAVTLGATLLAGGLLLVALWEGSQPPRHGGIAPPHDPRPAAGDGGEPVRLHAGPPAAREAGLRVTLQDPTGAPVSGARFSTRDGGPRVPLTTEMLAAGEYVVLASERGSGLLFVNAEGFEPQGVLVRPDAERVRLTLRPYARAQVVHVLDPAGRPVRFAEVWLGARSARTVRWVDHAQGLAEEVGSRWRSDDAGRVELRLRATDWSGEVVGTSADGRLRGQALLEDVLAAGVLRLHAQASTVSLRVLDRASGQPVRDATVVLGAPGHALARASPRTDDEGFVTIPLHGPASDVHGLVVEAPGYNRFQGWLRSGSSTPEVVRLDKARPWVVRVRDRATGQPLGGSAVRVFWHPVGTRWTEPTSYAKPRGAGTFELAIPMGREDPVRCWVIAEAPGYYPEGHMVHARDPEARCELLLARSCQAHVQVQDPDKTPVPGAAVYVQGERDPTTMGLFALDLRDTPVFTDERGLASVPAPVGGHVAVTAVAPQGASVRRSVAACSEDRPVVLVLESFRTIGVRLTDRDGAPVVGASVSVASLPGAPRGPASGRLPAQLSAVTDENGSCRVGALATRETPLFVEGAGVVSRRVSCAPGVDQVAVVLRRLGGISGRVADPPPGIPLTVAATWARPEGAGLEVQEGEDAQGCENVRASVAPDGSFHIGGLLQGETYWVRVDPIGSHPETLRVPGSGVVLAPSTVGWRLLTLSLTGIESPESVPQVTATVAYASDQGSRRATFAPFVDLRSQVVFPVPTGPSTVLLTGGDAFPVALPVDAGDGPASREVRLLGEPVDVLVLDADDRPRPSAILEMAADAPTVGAGPVEMGAGDTHRHTWLTGADGRRRVYAPVGHRPWRVVARAKGQASEVIEIVGPAPAELVLRMRRTPPGGSDR